MRTFTVNGVKYQAEAFDFNMICELEDMGISLEEAESKPMSLVRAYFSISSKLGKKDAGLQMQKHIVGGGNFDELMEVMSKEMEESDFFHALAKDATEK